MQLREVTVLLEKNIRFIFVYLMKFIYFLVRLDLLAYEISLSAYCNGACVNRVIIKFTNL